MEIIKGRDKSYLFFYCLTPDGRCGGGGMPECSVILNGSIRNV